MVNQKILQKFGLTWAQFPALILTLTLAAIGGWVAAWLRLPLGWLLGALLVTAVLAGGNLRVLGQPSFMPAQLRAVFLPIIGVSIGGAFTPAIAREVTGWGGTMLALLVFLPLVHWFGYKVYTLGGLPKKEAFFGAVPGGLIETVQLGEALGADVRLLTVLQFLRLIVTIVAVPLIFLGLTGSAVGSASGVQIGDGAVALTLWDWLILAACAYFGAVVARALWFPGWMMTGPLVASALAHVTGLVHGVPPVWLVALTQVVIGAGLGVKFAGVDLALLRRAGVLALINGAIALLTAFLFAEILQYVVDEDPVAIFLAYAPGGLAEMSLIALSMNTSSIFVSAHHVARIVLAVIVARFGVRLFDPPTKS